MKNLIEQYPSLKAALESNRVTYLFGSGMSSALSGECIGWIDWLNSGIKHLKDSSMADMLNSKLYQKDTKGNSISLSADSLIVIAGEIIASCKKDGVYDLWMHDSIEKLAIKNRVLAQTLKKTAITRDVLTTTNYDSLIEQAISAGSLTYKQSGKILEMLQKGEADSVVHLHGMYSSVLRINDIIADRSQYQELYNNEGAQFIQNLFGTSTLIFIGCGQTIEDENISRLTHFMTDKLNIKVTFLDAEFDAYQAKLNEQIEKMNAALERNRSKRLSEEETRELKKLYRAIVRLLHPDINPDLSEEKINLFHNAVMAHKNGDIDGLRIISMMVTGSTLPVVKADPAFLLVKERERLSKLLQSVREGIKEIKSEYPYNMKNFLQIPE